MVVPDIVAENLVALFKRKPRMKELFLEKSIVLVLKDKKWCLAYKYGTRHYGCRCKLRRKAEKKNIVYYLHFHLGEVQQEPNCKCRKLPSGKVKSFIGYTNVSSLQFIEINDTKLEDPYKYFIVTETVLPGELKLYELTDYSNDLTRTEAYSNYVRDYGGTLIGNYKSLDGARNEENVVMSSQSLLRKLGF